jgi:hypothetical protein
LDGDAVYPEPLLMVLIATGTVVPGTKAIFFCPTIPGPEIKKANMSLIEQL